MATPKQLLAFAGVGLFGTNAVPHFVKGVTGERHVSPAGEDSSPETNVLWGSANAAVAGVLAWTHRDAVDRSTLAVAFLTGVAFALGLASYWGDGAE
ncbi:hypothetical protein [Candidatus Halobonum tyrrellensis]|nr:hypothetical protein [Candidatus Halobonum tyrrellensis]